MTSRRDRGEQTGSYPSPSSARSFRSHSFLCLYQSLSTVITPQTAQGEAAEPPEGGGGADTHLLHTSISKLLLRHFHPSILISTCHPTWQVDRCNLQVSSSLMRTPGRLFLNSAPNSSFFKIQSH